MLQNTCHKLVSSLRKSKCICPVIKYIFTILGQGYIDVHTGGVLSVHRLRHKGCVQSVPLGNGFDCQLKSHNVICRPKSFIVFEIDFVLRSSFLMLGGFDFKIHVLQRQDDIPSNIFP